MSKEMNINLEIREEIKKKGWKIVKAREWYTKDSHYWLVNGWVTLQRGDEKRFYDFYEVFDAGVGCNRVKIVSTNPFKTEIVIFGCSRDGDEIDKLVAKLPVWHNRMTL